MADQTKKRDYSLLGESGRTAVDIGLAAAEWYHTEVARKEMKALMQRSDAPAIRDTIIWLGGDDRLCRVWLSISGGSWLSAVLPRLWGALRLGLR